MNYYLDGILCQGQSCLDRSIWTVILLHNVFGKKYSVFNPERRDCYLVSGLQIQKRPCNSDQDDIRNTSIPLYRFQHLDHADADYENEVLLMNKRTTMQRTGPTCLVHAWVRESMMPIIPNSSLMKLYSDLVNSFSGKRQPDIWVNRLQSELFHRLLIIVVKRSNVIGALPILVRRIKACYQQPASPEQEVGSLLSCFSDKIVSDPVIQIFFRDKINL